MATINPKIFKAYDIRAVYPIEMDEQGAHRIARAIFTFFKSKLNKDTFSVLLAHDMRTSSPSLYAEVKSAMVAMGAQVLDAGMLSTPTFYFAVSHYGADCGIQVTASHNPKNWNGMKFVLNTPEGLIKIGKSTGMEEIRELAMGSQAFPDAATPGTVTKKEGVLEDEVTNALQIAGNPDIKKFRIVADPANAMGITYLEAAAQRVPMDMVKMNFELDGTFPAHQPDPLQPENTADLRKRVVEEKADLGLAPDGDGDRLMFIDENGVMVPPSIITAIVARDLLRKNPGQKVVVDIRYLLTPKKIIEENGGEFVLVRVGHAFITEKLHSTGGIFGGESSGHYFFKATGNAESQLSVLFIILKVMSEEGKKLSEIAEELRHSYESGEFNFRVSNAPEIMDHIKAKYSDGKISAVDCIEIDYPDWRFSIRTSNTEPLMRLNVEAYEKATMEAKRDDIIAAIKSVAHIEEGGGH